MGAPDMAPQPPAFGTPGRVVTRLGNPTPSYLKRGMISRANSSIERRTLA